MTNKETRAYKFFVSYVGEGADADEAWEACLEGLWEDIEVPWYYQEYATFEEAVDSTDEDVLRPIAGEYIFTYEQQKILAKMLKHTSSNKQWAALARLDTDQVRSIKEAIEKHG